MRKQPNASEVAARSTFGEAGCEISAAVEPVVALRLGVQVEVQAAADGSVNGEGMLLCSRQPCPRRTMRGRSPGR
ncbi:hypothetical protein GCM10022226_47050 [Sphaerisporangium flaviroseum]|uniref:Uncharacterized protein n=1 Tax=Sphaerisporangium flaviroseum TaxID=509199 RepID=A0ABP7IL94_9ACTN